MLLHAFCEGMTNAGRPLCLGIKCWSNHISRRRTAQIAILPCNCNPSRSTLTFLIYAQLLFGALLSPPIEESFLSPPIEEWDAFWLAFFQLALLSSPLSLCLFPSTAYLFYLCRNEYFPLHELLLHYLDGILSHILPSHGILFYMDAKFNYFMEALTGFLQKEIKSLILGMPHIRVCGFFLFLACLILHIDSFFLSEILLREVLQFSARIVLHINSFA